MGISGDLLLGKSLYLYKILWKESDAVGSLWFYQKICLLLAFIFYNHTHGREMIDTFVHGLLVCITAFAGLVAFMEFLSKNNVLLELLRSSIILLQGTWFWQVS